MKLPAKPLCLYLGILAFAAFLLFCILDFIDTGILYPNYHCSYCGDGQYKKPHLYGMCERCADSLVWEARKELGGSYLQGRTDYELLGKVRKYLQWQNRADNR